ncbi:hypothetical protein PIB30_098265, partial [Stylosanthes scabra]|nr:hypothetical protein [Stylosanthes scabra]
LSFVIYLKESNRILLDPHFSVGTISTHRVILLDPVHLPESLLCLRKRKRKVFERSGHREEDNMDGHSDDGDWLLAEEGFKRKICEKYFATFQVLIRGHRSSYNKEKKSKSQKDDDGGGEKQLKRTLG